MKQKKTDKILAILLTLMLLLGWPSEAFAAGEQILPNADDSLAQQEEAAKEFDVLESQEMDKMSPDITQIDVKSFDNNRGNLVNVSASITDDIEVTYASATMVSPSGIEYSGNTMKKDEGSDIWVVEWCIPSDAETGLWGIIIEASDAAGNAKSETLFEAFSVTIPFVFVESLNLSAVNTKIMIGKTLQIKLTILPDNATNPDIVWSSSVPEVAVVNDAGVVTGKKCGITTITVTANDGSGKKSSYNVTVCPTAPTGAKAVSAGYQSIKISWGKVAGVNGYEVYRASSSNGKYTKVATIGNGNTLSYTDGNLQTEKTYYYKVCAYGTAAGKNVNGELSTVVKAKPVLARVTGAKAAIATYNSIKLSWSKVSGANGYEIYCASSKTGTYKKIKTITDENIKTYTNKSLVTGKTYYYKVKAYRTISGKKVYGGYSDIIQAKPILAQTKGTKAAATGYNAISVKWGKTSGASGYEIYRASSNSGAYKKVKTIIGNSTCNYVNKSLTGGKTYYYKIRAYRTISGAKVYGGYSAVAKATAKAAPIPTPKPTASVVYWVPSGKVYHVSRDCPTLSRSKVVLSGTISQSGKSAKCKVCG